MIRVVMNGIMGKMGQEMARGIALAPDLQLVGGADNKISTAITHTPEFQSLTFDTSLEDLLLKTQPDVMVDFTTPQSVMSNINIALKSGVRPVVGTTGISEENLLEIQKLCQEKKLGAFIAPNFSIGAVLMMKAAKEIARYLPHVEIIELHHDQKLDAPSGTALHTAKMISETRKAMHQGHPDETEKLSGARGGEWDGIRIHSVRLPGYVAHQEVIFGGTGQTLTIRHDSISRESFLPGVLLACKKVVQFEQMICGLENIID